MAGFPFRRCAIPLEANKIAHLDGYSVMPLRVLRAIAARIQPWLPTMPLRRRECRRFVHLKRKAGGWLIRSASSTSEVVASATTWR
jgi:hypothetical protein